MPAIKHFRATAKILNQLSDCPPMQSFDYSGDCLDPDDACFALDVRLKTLGVTDYRITKLSVV